MPGLIGRPVWRKEDARLITGAGRYTDDVHVPEETFAVFVRSPYTHARLRGVATAAAAAAPGVVAVLTAADYIADGHHPVAHAPIPADAIDPKLPAFAAAPDGPPIRLVRPYPLAHERVRHAGEAVAMVVARSAAAARDAAELVEVDYEPLDAVTDALDALDPAAPQLWDDVPENCALDVTFGADEIDATRAIAGADFSLTQFFEVGRVAGAQIEPRAAIGAFDADGYTLIVGNQGVTRHRAWIAESLGVDAARVRVVCHDVGGSFGIRQFLHPEDLLVVWAARRVGRPVRWTADRSEDFVADYQGRDISVQASMGCDRDGRIRAVHLSAFGNLGAYPVNFAPLQNYERIATSVYDVPLAHVHIVGVLTNTVPTVPFRGAGRPEATFVFERMLDIAALRLGLDRLEIRRRNLIPHAALPYTTPMGLTYDSGDFHGNMDRVCALADWNGFPARRAASEGRGLLRGIGLANYVEAPVGAPRERVRVRVQADGSVEIVTGTQSSGQGHETAYAQVVADRLDVPFESVRLNTGDTRFVDVGGGSHSNRSMRIVGTLLLEACAELRAQADAVAPGARDVFAAAARAGPTGLVCERDFFGRIPAHPTGAAVCEVEIDPRTGATTICGYAQVDDVGQAINPLIVEGQTHGGIAQGLGEAFGESVRYDQESGAYDGGSFLQYAAPRAHQLPPFVVELTEDPTAGNPLRIKGGGEGGVTPSPAAAVNAVCDALRELGTEHLDMPLTPEKVWSALAGMLKP